MNLKCIGIGLSKNGIIFIMRLPCVLFVEKEGASWIVSWLSGSYWLLQAAFAFAEQYLREKQRVLPADKVHGFYNLYAKAGSLRAAYLRAKNTYAHFPGTYGKSSHMFQAALDQSLCCS